ncbi:MAG: DUF3108 domain-containing protein [Bacteroidales bacterium]|nr:DUF3108 domain-containing protein [Bacteroidales bacterium]MBN2821508.1 DUF3108 domain-containing protein [Bacteroidales bacterium]
MKLKAVFFLTVLTSSVFLIPIKAQEKNKSEACYTTNNTFKEGEVLSYIVSYNWFVVFAEVGEVTLSIKKDRIFNQNAYHFVGEGRSFDWWDKFFKVRDRYEVWVRQDNLRPLFFQRNNREGNFRQHESYTFEGDSLIYRKNKVNDRPLKYDTLHITPCAFDVMGALLRTRNLDYDNVKVGEKIPVTVALDNELYDLYFRYQGIEDVKVKGLGTFECKKFTVLLVEGTLFHEGEDMILWVTNDKNHIPVYAESPILIGSVKVKITDIKGNKHPLSSKK